MSNTSVAALSAVIAAVLIVLAQNPGSTEAIAWPQQQQQQQQAADDQVPSSGLLRPAAAPSSADGEEPEPRRNQRAGQGGTPVLVLDDDSGYDTNAEGTGIVPLRRTNFEADEDDSGDYEADSDEEPASPADAEITVR